MSTLVPCDRTNLHPLDAALCIQGTENYMYCISKNQNGHQTFRFLPAPFIHEVTYDYYCEVLFIHEATYDYYS